MNLSALAKSRYATKAFDADKRIPQESIDELLALLRNSPSSCNTQPWHFVVASTSEGKARIGQGVAGAFSYNEAKVLNASHVIVLCARTAMGEQHMAELLEQEDNDGRFANDGARDGQRKTREMYVDLHKFDQKDLQHWMEKQVYLALGTLLVGAAALGLDAVPMEGFDPRKLDETLGLRARGFTSVVLLGLGYRSDADFNAKLPKSRLPAETVFTVL